MTQTTPEITPVKRGRPEKPIDWELFEKLCGIQCTHEELSAILGVAKCTLYERCEKHYELDFPTVYKSYTDSGKGSLRRKQFKLADKNASMAIFLGKVYLGQKEFDPKDVADYVIRTMNYNDAQQQRAVNSTQGQFTPVNKEDVEVNPVV